MILHACTGNIPARGKKIAAAPNEILPAPVAPAGRGGSPRRVPLRRRSYPAGLVHAVSGGMPVAGIPDAGRMFHATKKCTSCGTCETVCPVKNIEMTDKRAVWKDHCELCLACIRTCPEQAIRIDEKKNERDCLLSLKAEDGKIPARNAQ
jgi:ferredoxin